MDPLYYADGRVGADPTDVGGDDGTQCKYTITFTGVIFVVFYGSPLALTPCDCDHGDQPPPNQRMVLRVWVVKAVAAMRAAALRSMARDKR